MEKMIAKESLREQHMCILQGLEDSKEHNPGKSVLNPLQNSSDNYTSAWPCPRHFPGFTNWQMLTSASRRPVHAAAGAVLDCSHMEELPSKRAARLASPEKQQDILHISLIPVQGQMMRDTLLVPAPALPWAHTQENLLFSCAWLATEQHLQEPMMGGAQAAKMI